MAPDRVEAISRQGCRGPHIAADRAGQLPSRGERHARWRYRRVRPHKAQYPVVKPCPVSNLRDSELRRPEATANCTADQPGASAMRDPAAQPRTDRATQRVLEVARSVLTELDLDAVLDRVLAAAQEL